jgi:hypothetical protein
MWSAILPIVDVDLEDPIIIPYYGPKNMWPSLKINTYTPFQNLGFINFILMRLANLELCHVWMGTLKRFVLALRHLWLQVLNDNMYHFSHKLLLWILCVKSHSHILMGHATSRRWNDNKMGDVKFRHFYFIYMASMTEDKMMWTTNCHYND